MFTGLQRAVILSVLFLCADQAQADVGCVARKKTYDRDFRSQLGPVSDQGALGFCHAHAAADLQTQWLQKNRKTLDLTNFDFSKDPVSPMAMGLANLGEEHAAHVKFLNLYRETKKKLPAPLPSRTLMELVMANYSKDQKHELEKIEKKLIQGSNRVFKSEAEKLDFLNSNPEYFKRSREDLSLAWQFVNIPTLFPDPNKVYPEEHYMYQILSEGGTSSNHLFRSFNEGYVCTEANVPSNTEWFTKTYEQVRKKISSLGLSLPQGKEPPVAFLEVLYDQLNGTKNFDASACFALGKGIIPEATDLQLLYAVMGKGGLNPIPSIFKNQCSQIPKLKIRPKVMEFRTKKEDQAKLPGVMGLTSVEARKRLQSEIHKALESGGIASISYDSDILSTAMVKNSGHESSIVGRELVCNPDGSERKRLILRNSWGKNKCAEMAESIQVKVKNEKPYTCKETGEFVIDEDYLMKSVDGVTHLQ